VDAAEARRAVVIGGSRRGPPCPACAGSGASGATAEGRALRDRAGEFILRAARRAKGKRAALALLRLDAVQRCPCDACGGAGAERLPSVDQQVAQFRGRRGLAPR
jgi:hypothetical protein